MIHPDEILAQRLVDGFLSGEEEKEARARLARDGAFRALVEELQAARALFSAQAEEEAVKSAAPPGFSSRVAMAARAGLAGGPDLVSWTRKLSWAAAALLFLSLAVLAGFRASQGGTTLSADDLGRRYEGLLQRARLREGKLKSRLEERSGPKKKEGATREERK